MPPLGPHLGCRDPEHIRRWMTAMWAGAAAAPKCEGTNRDGTPCRKPRMRGATRCQHHLTGPERDRVDAARIPSLTRIAASNVAGADKAANARRSLRAIEKRRLHRAWLLDPTVPGSTLDLDASDERVARGWLADNGVDIEAQALTARAVDRVRWAGFLTAIKGTMTPEAGRRRIVLALRDDERWHAKQAKNWQAKMLGGGPGDNGS